MYILTKSNEEKIKKKNYKELEKPFSVFICNFKKEIILEFLLNELQSNQFGISTMILTNAF